MTRKSAGEYRPITIDEMTEASRRDPVAVTAIATAMAQEWLGHFPSLAPVNSFEFMKHVYVCRPAARKQFTVMRNLNHSTRTALGRALLAAK
jgi:hypothetical protein